MKGTASRDAAALQKAPSRNRARRRTGEEDRQFKHVRPCSKSYHKTEYIFEQMVKIKIHNTEREERTRQRQRECV